jgi:protease-4
MVGKKHPILTVLVILAVIVLILGVTMTILLKMFTPFPGLSFHEEIGVISVEGTITSSRITTSQLVKFKKDKGIRAIILRINSPGGAVGPTQEIYREILKTAKTKKVVASMGGVAASGGYYIAAGADKIVANPGTITGSIGVLMEFVQLEDLLKKIGINLEVMKSGEFKDVGFPHRKLTTRDRELINSLLADIQKQFVEGVDVLGNFEDAVEIAKDMAGIKGEVTLVYSKKERPALWDLLLETATRFLSQVLQRTKPQLEYRWGGFLEN